MSRNPGSPERANVYTRITHEIVAAIEAGTGSWSMPWHHDGSAITRPSNVASRKRYRGINVLALWIAAEARGYGSGLWGTFRQWQSAGAQVRKGERGTTVVLWKPFGGESATDRGDGEQRSGGMFARAFSVFNLAQVEGYEPPTTATLPESERITHAEAFVANLNIPVTEGAYDAHYRIDLDRIFMPSFRSFRDPVSAIGVLIHEVCNIASVLISRTVDGLCALLFPNHRTACCAISGRES